MSLEDSRWTEADVPRLDGKVALVTGANGGLGVETARVLAARGARVLMACRTVAKGEAVAEHLRQQQPDADVQVLALDLADLSSVGRCAAQVQEEVGSLDLLINNAGIMAIPRRDTADGLEMQLGTNHIGHFALTARLLPLLAPEARIVTVSSQAHRMGWMAWSDLMGQRRYDKWLSYGQSKLANLLFHFELDRRLRASGATQRAVAAHPGYAATNLQHVGPQLSGSPREAKLMRLANRYLAQSATHGALPSLRAATDPKAQGGDYFGPDGFWEVRGWPVLVGHANRAGDVADAARLWRHSEAWTGLSLLSGAALTQTAGSSDSEDLDADDVDTDDRETEAPVAMARAATP